MKSSKLEENDKGYVSCLKLNGIPLIAPLITNEDKILLEKYKLEAIAIENRLKHMKNLTEINKNIRLSKIVENEKPSPVRRELFQFKGKSVKNQHNTSIGNKIESFTKTSEYKGAICKKCKMRTPKSPHRKNIVSLDRSHADKNQETPSRRIRRNSYTLESPTPEIVEHLYALQNKNKKRLENQNEQLQEQISTLEYKLLSEKYNCLKHLNKQHTYYEQSFLNHLNQNNQFQKIDYENINEDSNNRTTNINNIELKLNDSLQMAANLLDSINSNSQNVLYGINVGSQKECENFDENTICIRETYSNEDIKFVKLPKTTRPCRDDSSSLEEKNQFPCLKDCQIVREDSRNIDIDSVMHGFDMQEECKDFSKNNETYKDNSDFQEKIKEMENNVTNYNLIDSNSFCKPTIFTACEEQYSNEPFYFDVQLVQKHMQPEQFKIDGEKYTCLSNSLLPTNSSSYEESKSPNSKTKLSTIDNTEYLKSIETNKNTVRNLMKLSACNPIESMHEEVEETERKLTNFQLFNPITSQGKTALNKLIFENNKTYHTHSNTNNKNNRKSRNSNRAKCKWRNEKIIIMPDDQLIHSKNDDNKFINMKKEFTFCENRSPYNFRSIETCKSLPTSIGNSPDLYNKHQFDYFSCSLNCLDNIENEQDESLDFLDKPTSCLEKSIERNQQSMFREEENNLDLFSYYLNMYNDMSQYVSEHGDLISPNILKENLDQPYENETKTISIENKTPSGTSASENSQDAFENRHQNKCKFDFNVANLTEHFNSVLRVRNSYKILDFEDKYKTNDKDHPVFLKNSLENTNYQFDFHQMVDRKNGLTSQQDISKRPIDYLSNMGDEKEMNDSEHKNQCTFSDKTYHFSALGNTNQVQVNNDYYKSQTGISTKDDDFKSKSILNNKTYVQNEDTFMKNTTSSIQHENYLRQFKNESIPKLDSMYTSESEISDSISTQSTNLTHYNISSLNSSSSHELNSNIDSSNQLMNDSINFDSDIEIPDNLDDMERFLLDLQKKQQIEMTLLLKKQKQEQIWLKEKQNKLKQSVISSSSLSSSQYSSINSEKYELLNDENIFIKNQQLATSKYYDNNSAIGNGMLIENRDQKYIDDKSEMRENKQSDRHTENREEEETIPNQILIENREILIKNPNYDKQITIENSRPKAIEELMQNRACERYTQPHDAKNDDETNKIHDGERFIVNKRPAENEILNHTHMRNPSLQSNVSVSNKSTPSQYESCEDWCSPSNQKQMPIRSMSNNDDLNTVTAFAKGTPLERESSNSSLSISPLKSKKNSDVGSLNDLEEIIDNSDRKHQISNTEYINMLSEYFRVHNIDVESLRSSSPQQILNQYNVKHIDENVTNFLNPYEQNVTKSNDITEENVTKITNSYIQNDNSIDNLNPNEQNVTKFINPYEQITNKSPDLIEQKVTKNTYSSEQNDNVIKNRYLEGQTVSKNTDLIKENVPAVTNFYEHNENVATNIKFNDQNIPKYNINLNEQIESKNSNPSILSNTYTVIDFNAMDQETENKFGSNFNSTQTFPNVEACQRRDKLLLDEYFQMCPMSSGDMTEIMRKYPNSYEEMKKYAEMYPKSSDDDIKENIWNYSKSSVNSRNHSNASELTPKSLSFDEIIQPLPNITRQKSPSNTSFTSSGPISLESLKQKYLLTPKLNLNQIGGSPLSFHEFENNAVSRLHQEVRSKVIIKNEYSDIEKKAALKLTAGARGFFVRRLFKTQRVQLIKDTIEDTLRCAMSLQNDVAKLNTSDIELHTRLIQQLTAACYQLHDTFFSLSTKEKLAIIAQDRDRLKNLKLAQMLKIDNKQQKVPFLKSKKNQSKITSEPRSRTHHVAKADKKNSATVVKRSKSVTSEDSLKSDSRKLDARYKITRSGSISLDSQKTPIRRRLVLI